ncbi:MAG: TetR/AcrR family transcriptional regulator [Chlorobiaceae bacterium]|nr:TetR/AcrR family transcriptional regulator [Chlorobiaceae bacterium]
MARPKKVSSDQILDAIERVVVKHGAARLSIDAVAQEAGISKSRVVLDYKSKSALLDALIERELQMESKRIETMLESCRETPHPELFARVKLAEEALDDKERAVTMAISSSLSSDSSVRRRMLEWVNHDLQAMDSGPKPEVARMAYFALVGFSCHEWFGLIDWCEEERLLFMEQLRSMYRAVPEFQPSSQPLSNPSNE